MSEVPSAESTPESAPASVSTPTPAPISAPVPSSGATPEITIIAPHLNQPDLLRVLLASLFAQDYDMTRAQVIIVDNGSRTVPHDVVAEFPGVTLLTEATPGPGPARNCGIARATAPIVAFTDSDCQVDRHWIPTILKHFAADPALEILGGDMQLILPDPTDPTPVEAFECVYAFPQTLYIFQKGYSVTANMAVRRPVLDTVGAFAGIGVSEDREWGQRARAMGHITRWKPDVIVNHPARRTMDELRDKCDRNVSLDFTTQANGVKGRVFWTVKALALAASPLTQIPKLARTDRLTGRHQRWRAFQGLAGFRLYKAQRMLKALVSEEVRTASTQWNRGDRSMAGKDS